MGGAVRDSLMGRDPHDWDVATNAPPTAVCKLFPHVVETGMKHGTVTVVCDSLNVEVTTFRLDGEYEDGRRPNSVSFGCTLFEDLSRRDFTMNAVAYDPIDNVFEDPFGGMKDIENKLIKCVGNPYTRFREDGLRLVRALRFMATLEFNVDLHTLWAISQMYMPLDNVSVERVKDELFKVMTAPKPSRMFNATCATNVLEKFIPEHKAMINCTQNRWHAYDVWTHTMKCVNACPPDPILRFAALFHDVAKPIVKGKHHAHGDATFYDHENVGADMADTILRRLKFSNTDREKIVHLVREHFVRYDSSWSSATIRRWVRRVGVDNVKDILTLARADNAAKGPVPREFVLDNGSIDELEQRIADLNVTEKMPVSTKVLAIDGTDVMRELNIPQGKRVGEVLRALLELVTDDPELNMRENLLKMCKDVS